MTEIVDARHQAAARRFKQLYSTYEQHRDLISVGAYQRGADPRVDEAIDFYPRLVQFLQQDMREAVGMEDSRRQLEDMLRPRETEETPLDRQVATLEGVRR
jgi:flagellum-specific ATP synthase